MTWIKVCALDDIVPNSGVCAKINEQQVAVFREAESDQIYAIGNYDPFSDANVLSRGLMAQLDDQITVASPMYKQHFNLQTGQCLEDETVSIPVYKTQVIDNMIVLEAK